MLNVPTQERAIWFPAEEERGRGEEGGREEKRGRGKERRGEEEGEERLPPAAS